MPYLVGKDSFYMQSTVALLKRRSRSPERRHDVAQKFWASVIPEVCVRLLYKMWFSLREKQSYMQWVDINLAMLNGA